MTTSETETEDRAIATEAYRLAWADAERRVEYQVQFASSLIKNLQLVNGGAIIAILTFLGSSVSKFDKYQIYCAFIIYGVGLSSALLTNLFAFGTQHFFMEGSARFARNARAKSYGRPADEDTVSPVKTGNILEGLAVVCAIASLTCFIWASLVAVGGLFVR